MLHQHISQPQVLGLGVSLHRQPRAAIISIPLTPNHASSETMMDRVAVSVCSRSQAERLYLL